MRLIIGGASQGKLDFTMKNYGLKIDEIADGRELDISEILKYKCVNNYHILVKRLLENGEAPIDFASEFILKNPGIIIIMNEIGGGIIPMEKDERIWREQVGKVGCLLAEKADTVERIVCGIALKIKG